MTRIAMLTVGDELLDGRVADANAAWAGRQLAERGRALHEWRCVPDDVGAIADAVLQLAERAELIVVSGGIGPTSDDLTRAGIARAAGVELDIDQDTVERLRERYARRGRSMPTSNLRQAEFPAGSEVLQTGVGTADACRMRIGRARVVSLPGVPREFRALFERWVLPDVPSSDLATWSTRLHGRGESGLADIVDHLLDSDQPQVAWRATAPWVDLSLRGDAASVSAASASLRRALAPWQLPDGARSWADVVAKRLTEADLTISTAESCTGGAIAAALTAIPGASTWFPGGVVAYANRTKREQLGVSAQALDAWGAVSHPVALQMAQGARRSLPADIGLGTTGIAGPTGGSATKPVGTVYLACATDRGCVVAHCCFRARSRAAFVAATTQMALRLVVATMEDRPRSLRSCDDVLSVEHVVSPEA